MKIVAASRHLCFVSLWLFVIVCSEKCTFSMADVTGGDRDAFVKSSGHQKSCRIIPCGECKLTGTLGLIRQHRDDVHVNQVRVALTHLDELLQYSSFRGTEMALDDFKDYNIKHDELTTTIMKVCALVEDDIKGGCAAVLYQSTGLTIDICRVCSSVCYPQVSSLQQNQNQNRPRIP